MLKALGWKAHPLQPCKADSLSMGWLVGVAEEPPKMIMATDAGDMMISLHRSHAEGDSYVTLTSSAKIQGYLRKIQKEPQSTPQHAKPKVVSTSLTMGAAEPNPRSQTDPWSTWQPSRVSAAMEDEPMHAKSMIESVKRGLLNPSKPPMKSDSKSCKLTWPRSRIKTNDMNNGFQMQVQPHSACKIKWAH